MGSLSVSSSITPRDRALLSALANPANDADAVLATLQPEDVGPWLERPEIKSAIAAAFELREIRLRFKLTAATDRAIDRMTAVFDAGKDLADAAQRADTRRAASAILRFASGSTGLRPVSGFSTPSRGTGVPPVPTQSSFLTRLRPRVRPAPNVAPDHVAALAVTALSNPDDQALADLAPFLIHNGDKEPPDPEGLALGQELDVSPATAARYAVTGRTPDRLNYTVTLARRDRRPSRFMLSLFKRDCSPHRDCWLIHGIIDATDPPAQPVSSTHSANTS